MVRPMPPTHRLSPTRQQNRGHQRIRDFIGGRLLGFGTGRARQIQCVSCPFNVGGACLAARQVTIHFHSLRERQLPSQKSRKPAVSFSARDHLNNSIREPVARSTSQKSYGRYPKRVLGGVAGRPQDGPNRLGFAAVPRTRGDGKSALLAHDAGLWLYNKGTVSDAPDIPAVIRCFRSEDQAACKALYSDGLVGGKIADNDTGYDVDQIEAAYMKASGDHFWVAQSPDGQVVGMIGVQHHDEGTGQIRRLRVHPDWRRRGIGAALLETAVRFCQQRNYLKVTLDTFMQHDPAVRLFEKFGFRHYRTRNIAGKDLVYFYLDLYARGEHRDPHAQPR